MSQRRVPRATYRLQLHPGFTFEQAAEVVGYLADLGVSHLYCSPYLQAAPGSTHGYDAVDHSRINEELGGTEGHRRLGEALARHGLGQVLDVVPNHMAISLPHNRWFWDVLEHGPSSHFAGHFDVDWDPPEARMRNLILLPILGDHYGRVLEAGEIRLEQAGGAFCVRYLEQMFPVAPPSLDDLLDDAARRCGSDDLAFVAASLRRLPRAVATDRPSRLERHRDTRVLYRQLRRLVAEPAVAGAIGMEVDELNADVDALDRFLDRQNYRLAYWRAAGQDLGYRRFFDIDTLIGLRVEDPQVFADTHALVLEWLREGLLDGVRIDHPDGLRRPGEYFDRLRQAAPGAWIIAEKILEPGESLPASWPIDGTTGYDFLNALGAVFVDPQGAKPLDELYAEMTGAPTDYGAVAYEAKHQVLHGLLAADLNRLTQRFVEVTDGRRRYRDFTRLALRETLAEVAASLGVYRTYIREDGSSEAGERDRIEAAVVAARARRQDLDPELFGLLQRILLGDPALNGTAEVELRTRFQQLTGSVTAKGVEDTAFYRYLRLSALCEVGGNPDWFGYEDLTAFHERCERIHGSWPATMLALSTHDTKRSEDVRARLYLLSEIPQRWGEAVHRWTEQNSLCREGPSGPDANMEYLLYQTLVGAHPLPLDRALAYLEKAAKEAKVHTSWVDPAPAYDQALRCFVERLYDSPRFMEDLARFVEPLILPGWVTSLAQKLVQLTAPGVPDLYQGSELWDLSLVDPDNRRPIDYELRRRLLDELGGLGPEEIWSRAAEGLPKLWVIQRALGLRAQRSAAFAPGPDGAYERLGALGPAAHHVVAFSRGGQVATVVPRLVLGLAARGGWADTSVVLAGGRWTNVLTGERRQGGEAPLSELLARFPVALLAREEGP